MLPYITISKFATESGYSEHAIRTKIRDLIWCEANGVVAKAPDGRVLISTKGYEKWVEMGQALKSPLKLALKSPSCIKDTGAEKGLRSSPPPLISRERRNIAP